MNVFVDSEDRSKLEKLVTLGPMVSQLRVDGNYKNFDCLGEGKANFSTCHDLNLTYCKFTNQQKFEDFLLSLESSKYLARLKLWGLGFQEEGVLLNQRLVDLIQSNPI